MDRVNINDRWPTQTAPLELWQHDIPWIDPHRAAAAFADLPALALLDSTGPIEPNARHACLCVDPYRIITDTTPDPLAALAEALAATQLPHTADAMPFRGGAAGFIGYEYAAGLDRIQAAPAAADDPPDLFMGLYDLVIGFDRARRLARIHASGLPERAPAARAARARARIAWAADRLARAAPQAAPPPVLAWQPAWTRADYESRVERILAYIRAGDIFQANLTMRHVAARPPGLDAWQVHHALRQANPAPFGAWLRCGAVDLCCSSPERFIQLGADRTLRTQPIKGTAARAAEPRADAALAAALAASDKDRAENVMIVDVLRHDLGRVGSIGSVRVPQLCALQSFATVHHLVSTITARLRPGLGAVDVLRAALPGGSITGAPKIRAMQIIAELEGSRRGPYCGTIAALGFDGAMDSNIVIRSLVLTPERVIAQAGGGIVAESRPDREWAEMMLKSAPMRSLFAGA